LSIINITNVLKITAAITQQEQDNIKNYLLGAVNCWCKNCLDSNGNQQWFSVSNLIGTANSKVQWNNTPLEKLYVWHRNNNPSNAMTGAGMDAGNLLKEVLFYDSRNFDTQKVQTAKEYKLQ